jgi:hypothetical protein
MKKNNERQSNTSLTQEEENWEAVYGIETPKGAELVIGSQGNVLRVDFSRTPYPKNGTAVYEETKSLLLESVIRHPSNLKLPNNSTSLANILNEAAGSTDSFEVAPNTSRTLKLVTEIFRVLAADLITVADTKHKVPTKLTLKQILVNKENYEAKLLPPIEFQEVSKRDVNVKIKEIGAQILQSMSEGSTTPAQRALTDMLSGPIKEIFH